MAAAFVLGVGAMAYIQLQGGVPRGQETAEMVGRSDSVLDHPPAGGPGERPGEEDIQAVREESQDRNPEDTPPNEASTVDQFVSLPAAALPENNDNEDEQEEAKRQLAPTHSHTPSSLVYPFFVFDHA